MPYIGNKTADTVIVEDNSVTSAKIVDSAVTTAKINNDAVTVDKLNLISTSSVPSLEAKGTSGVTEGYIQLNCAENSHGIKLKSPPHSAGASYTLTFPNNDGNANQFLQTDGSGVLSFADAGSDIVKLGSVSNYSSTVSAIDVDLFSSSYKYYRFIATLRAESGSADLRFRWRTGGSEQAGSYYIYASHRVQINSGGTITTGNLFSGFFTDHAQIANNMTASNSHDTLIDWTFYDPMRITLTKPYVQGLVQSYRDDDVFRQSYFGAKYNSGSMDYNGFRLYLSTGNLEDFQYVMYGVKE